eukprot:3337371-Amphidinium_carterae.1
MRSASSPTSLYQDYTNTTPGIYMLSLPDKQAESYLAVLREDHREYKLGKEGLRHYQHKTLNYEDTQD